MIGEKIISIMEEIKPVKKTGVDEENNFKYPKAEDIIAMVRPLLVKHKVAIVPKSVKNFISQGNKVYLTMLYQIIDMEDENKECIEVEVPASGQSEIGRAAFSALTGAYKYVMQQPFAIPIAEDDDMQNGNDKQIKEENNAAIGFSEDMQDIKTLLM